MGTAGVSATSSSSGGPNPGAMSGAGGGSGLTLDGSGLTMGGSSATGGASDVMNGECARQDFALQGRPAEILIVLDRSGSMKEKPSGSSGGSKWSLVVPGVNEVVTATNATVSWGLKVFPEGEGDECAVDSVTSSITVPVAPTNAQAVTDAVTATTPEGNGTPTGDAVNAGVAYLKGLPDSNPKFILLATDGEPSCAGTNKSGTAARALAVKAVTDAAAAGIKTFVVGVATTKDSATQVLNDLAVAGQMARTDMTAPATKYYLASTKEELVKSLELITGQAASCVFDLTKAPPDPSNIAVHINDVGAPKDPSHMNGWDYTDASYTRVEVFGSWCDQIKGASANAVNFVLGCPGEVVH